MSETIKKALSLISPLGAAQEQVKLQGIEIRQYKSLIEDQRLEIENLKAKNQVLKTDSDLKTKQIERLQEDIKKCRTANSKPLKPMNIGRPARDWRA